MLIRDGRIAATGSDADVEIPDGACVPVLDVSAFPRAQSARSERTEYVYTDTRYAAGKWTRETAS